MLRDSDKLAALSPCFVFDRECFLRNVNSFVDAFESRLPKFTLAYSTKTNPHQKVLEAVRSSNRSRIEIVSPHELGLAMRAGFSFNEVVYNGVIPDPEGKFIVAANGGVVNLENVLEVKTLSRMAASRNTKIRIGIRLNANIGQNYESRFGIKPESPEFYECLDQQHECFEIVGIHAHLHGNRWLEGWEKRAEILGLVAKRFGAKYIDFGSNMFGYMDSRLADQFSRPVPNVEEYADVIHKVLQRYFEEIPEVIIEAGTPIVANAMTMAGVITNITESHATASCSIYDCGFFRGSDKHPPIDVIHRNRSSPEMMSDATIYGYACTEDDVVCRSYTGPLAVGDLILVRNVGAYGFSLSSDFINPKPIVFPLNIFQ